MPGTNIKIEEVLSKALDIFKTDWVVLILAGLVTIFGSIFIVTIAPLFYGLYLLCLKLVRGEEAEVQDVFKGFKYFTRSWGIFLAAGILIILGFVALVLPGIALIVLFTYILSLSVIKDLKAIDSLKASYNLARENLSFTIILVLVTMGLSAIGEYIKVGVFLTVPFNALVTVLAAYELTKED